MSTLHYAKNFECYKVLLIDVHIYPHEIMQTTEEKFYSLLNELHNQLKIHLDYNWSLMYSSPEIQTSLCFLTRGRKWCLSRDLKDVEDLGKQREGEKYFRQMETWQKPRFVDPFLYFTDWYTWEFGDTQYLLCNIVYFSCSALDPKLYNGNS